jgi:hypothetical protein
MNVCPLFVANAQAAKMIEPGEGSFHDPPPLAQSAAVFGVALRKKRNDASAKQTTPVRRDVPTLSTGCSRNEVLLDVLRLLVTGTRLAYTLFERTFECGPAGEHGNSLDYDTSFLSASPRNIGSGIAF